MRQCKIEQILKWIQNEASSNTHEIDLSLILDAWNLIRAKKKLFFCKIWYMLNICACKITTNFLDYWVLICGFHREQAWVRLLNATRNGARMVKDIMLFKFRSIARVRTAEELRQALNELRNCE